MAARFETLAEFILSLPKPRSSATRPFSASQRKAREGLSRRAGALNG
jgi:hypothetical protein